jgi:hypothetical protein
MANVYLTLTLTSSIPSNYPRLGLGWQNAQKEIAAATEP